MTDPVCKWHGIVSLKAFFDFRPNSNWISKKKSCSNITAQAPARRRRPMREVEPRRRPRRRPRRLRGERRRRRRRRATAARP